MSYAHAAKTLTDAYGYRMRASYEEWLESTDYDYPMDDMIELLAQNKVWERELTRFMGNNWEELKDQGFAFKELTCCWYLTRIVNGPNPPRDYVTNIYLHAFT